MEEFEDFRHLSEDHRLLLREIAAQFSPEDSAADLGILFECTGFRAGTENSEFWDNYKDFDFDEKDDLSRSNAVIE